MGQEAHQNPLEAGSQSDTCSEMSEKNTGVIVEIPRHFYPIFFSMGMLALAAAFSSTSLTVSLATIAQDFDLSTPEAFWLGTATALTMTVVQPGSACFADLVGRRWALSLSAAALALGSLLAAVAQNYATLIAGRSLQGIGVGGVYTITEIIITDLVPLRLRGIWFALLSIFSAIGMCSGPILSGVLTKTTSWRWIFGVNVILTVVAMVACFITLPYTPRRGDSTMDQLRRVDFLGFAILSASIVSFLVPLMQAGVVYPWADVRTLLPLILGLVGILAFLVFEQKWAKFPLVPLAQFSSRTCLLAFVCSFAQGLALWCLMYYIPLYYEFVKGFNTLESGVATLPEMLTIVVAAAAAGFFVSWTGKYRGVIWLGWATSAVGMGILILLNPSTSTASWVLLNIPIGLGMGILSGSLQFALQASVDPEQLPLAVTLFMFWRSFGAALGIAIGSAIFSSETSSNISPKRAIQFVVGAARGPVKAELSRVIQARSIQDILLMDMETRLWGLRKIWIFCIILCFMTLVASLGIKSFSLDTPLRNKERKESGEEVV